MQLTPSQILTAMAFGVAVTAKPAPGIAKRTVVGTAWDLAGKAGDAYNLVDTGDECHSVLLGSGDGFSSIEMLPDAFECFFWTVPTCRSVDVAMSLRDGDFWDIPSSPWADFNNAILSYKCDGVSAQAGTAYEGAFGADTIPLYTAKGACVNLKYLNDFTSMSSVTVDSTYTCTFYKDIDCAGDNAVVSSAAQGSIDFSNPPLPYYDGFDNVISSYKCSSL